jgi:NitT/TauT family transport system permease protein
MARSRTYSVPTAWVRGAVGAGVVFVLAELLTRAELVNEQYLPPASSILVRTGELLTSGEFLHDVWVTLQACLIGLGLAILIAVPIGLALGSSELAHKAATAVIEFLRPIPSVALIPLAIPIFGRGTDMKVALVLFACAWPLLFNTIYGMRQVDQVAVDTARVLGLGPLRRGTGVYLRSASPFVFTGVKIATGIAVILAVSCELIAGGAEGIGIRMSAAAAVGDQKTVYAITIIAGLLGLVLVMVLAVAERRLFAWADVEREL